jgi:V/A-type H+-transporting ATPase subunit E
MSNAIENITLEIIADAKAEADQIIEAAKAKAGEITALARESAQSELTRIMTDTDRRLSIQRAAADSERKLLKRQAVLRARQSALNTALDNAKRALSHLPDNEYFALCIKLAVIYAQSGEGELIFNSRDKDRMPDSFPNLLKLALPIDKLLRVSDDTAKIDGGFVLRYGKMEENCSFSAIFREKRDVFIDLIREPLFEEAD